MHPTGKKGSRQIILTRDSDWIAGSEAPGFFQIKPSVLPPPLTPNRKRICSDMSTKEPELNEKDEPLETASTKTEESSMKKARQGSFSKEEEQDIRKSLKASEKEEEAPILPDPKVDCDPDIFIQQLVKALYGVEPKTKKALDLGAYFPNITDEQIAAYDISVVSATRENDMERLKNLYKDKEMSMECCNRFGETLLHMACRRGFREIGDFLLNDANVSVRVRDDCGRTPFHDVCWNAQPQLELAEALLHRDPTLLLISDKRGHTPFQYARPQDWPVWRQFVFDQRHHFKVLLDDERKSIFC